MTYAFSFDARSCSGCKACQVACKDKNNLPTGVFWRRVIEVSGGEWAQAGDAWTNTIFAYNLSLACNHCVHPKCAGVCPVDAYTVRPDGIVLLDSSRCAGCGYCNWACPYAVPQYNQFSGVMGKCNFCFDALEAGEPPACVAACPLRVLDYTEVKNDAPVASGLALWSLPGDQHPYPLPEYSRTQPHLLLKPHPAMSNPLVKQVGNLEELRPLRPKSELPLVFFTLLAQLSVGVFWGAAWMFAPLQAFALKEANLLRNMTAFLGLLVLLAGGLAAFAHLGHKRNAWRMLCNLRKSWLSRELFFVGSFVAGWLLSLVAPGPFTTLLVAVLGLGLIRAMANVYRLRSMAAWNSWRTLVGFLLSTLLLGQFLLVPLLLAEAHRLGLQLSDAHILMVNTLSALLLVVEHVLAYALNDFKNGLPSDLRAGLTVVMLAVLAGLPLVGMLLNPWPYVVLFLLLAGEEFIGRQRFYAELEKRRL